MNLKDDFARSFEKTIIDEVYEFFTEFLPMQGYEEREGQQDMALDICEAMRDKEHIMVEAGVGIGKSYAYLVPLMLFNKVFNEPVVVSTSTISLQEQLMDDILEISKKIDYYPEVTLAKGMTHFACLQRIVEYFEYNDYAKNGHEDLYKDIRQWAEKNGDRAQLSFNISDEIWNEIHVSNCSYSKCEFYSKCRFLKKRGQMANTEGVILCNHDLLIVDAEKKQDKERPLLSDRIKYIVIDEGHNLEEKARGILQKELKFQRCINIVKEAKKFSKKFMKSSNENKYNDLLKNIERYFKAISSDINNQMKIGKFQGTDQSKFSIAKEKVAIISKKLISLIDEILSEISFIEVGITGEYDYYDRLQDEIIESLKRMKGNIYNIQYDSLDTLSWVEFTGNKCEYHNIIIIAAPKEMNKEIYNLLFKERRSQFHSELMPRIIVTSATLTNKFTGSLEDKYDYITRNIGYPYKDGKGIFSEPKNSPFDYKNNTIVYYKNKMPHPIREKKDFERKALIEIKNLIEITKGRTLILFSAKEDLNHIYNGLMNAECEYKFLKQSKYSSQEKVLKEFVQDKSSVLLGTGVFWEGINLPGETLSQVIIYRLPFPVPDPIIDYKRSISENPLMDVNVPEMITKLRQGTGRLIRNAFDTGVVSILDPRIGDSMKMEYKDEVWNALPFGVKTNDYNDLIEFAHVKIENRIKQEERKINVGMNFNEFSTKKYLGMDDNVEVFIVPCTKAFARGCVEIRSWVEKNRKSINEKTKEVAGIFGNLMERVLSSLTVNETEIIYGSFKSELEKLKRKLFIWKKKRISVGEESEIFDLIEKIRLLKEEKLSKEMKFKYYTEHINEEHDVLCFNEKEKSKMSNNYVQWTGKESLDKVTKDVVVMFEYKREVIDFMIEKHIKCKVLIYDFERDTNIKNNR